MRSSARIFSYKHFFGWIVTQQSWMPFVSVPHDYYLPFAQSINFLIQIHWFGYANQTFCDFHVKMFTACVQQLPHITYVKCLQHTVIDFQFNIRNSNLIEDISIENWIFINIHIICILLSDYFICHMYLCFINKPFIVARVYLLL